MPFVYNFNECKDGIHTVQVNPQGWRGPITIEYGYSQVNKYDTQISVVWRVKGTSHTFTIYERKLNVVSHADYKKHFEEVLGNFRIEYLNWFSDPTFEKADWKYEYEREYGRYILQDKGGDNVNKNQ